MAVPSTIKASLLLLVMFTSAFISYKIIVGYNVKFYGTISKTAPRDGYKKLLYQRASYEHDVVNCSTKVFSMKEEKEFREYLDETKGEEPKCSPAVFRKYFREQNRFFGDGAWHVISRTFPIEKPGDFYPYGCVFDKNITSDSHLISKCFRQRNISKILLTGDSNGNHYSAELRNFLSNRSKICEFDDRGPPRTTRYDIGKSGWNSEYFHISNKTVFWKKPGCPHCGPYTLQCKQFGSENLNVWFQFIGMSALLEHDLIFSRPPDGSDFILDKPTFMEILLRDYLPYRGFPDLWIVSPPLHHEAWSKDVVQFRENLTLFRRLLDHYLPPTTKVLLLADIRECPMYRLDIVQLFRRQLKTTRSRNEVFHAMNQVIFDTFRDHLLADDGQYLAFLDAGRILCPFTCSWHDDGGHMRPFVYEMFLKYIFEYLCAE